ncbi:glycosyltransferase family 2 protein [Roseibium alexandrii]|uniref:glycosyltransferase family 2 protein n=1 Tax=Roseibium alexandrii TaxID=388408 RepID=UPI0037501262
MAGGGGALDPAGGDAPLLTVSLVIYRPDLKVLAATLQSLFEALKRLDAARCKVFIVQNCDTDGIAQLLATNLSGIAFDLRQGHGNIGFGRAHNLVLSETGTVHLVLNPDIEMAEEALVRGLQFLEAHTECGLITPYACWPDGTRQFLCKRYPALFDLLLRGFAPASLKNLFSGRLARYEMSRETGEDVYWDPPIVSGCFMLFRGEIYRQLGGFDSRFFLYFEDFDLALRTGNVSRIAYVPAARIVHEGGHAARKGLTHIKLFAKSARLFYKLHGFKLF